MTSAITHSIPPQIKTERLVLRLLGNDDLDALHAIMSDAETMRYWSSMPHIDKRQTLDWITVNRAAMIAGTAIEYGAEYEGRLIGRGTFWNSNEIGYIFDKNYWGQGFATECMTAMIAFAFTFKEWADIRADIDPRNLASLKLLERLGFQRTGFKEKTFCIGGNWSDSLYLTLMRPTWQALQKSNASSL